MLFIEKATAESAMAYLKTQPGFKTYKINAFPEEEADKEKKTYIRVIVGRHVLENMLNGLVGNVLNGHSSCYATVD